MYQLQKPQISDYDCILVDEAQDLTPGDSCTPFLILPQDFCSFHSALEGFCYNDTILPCIAIISIIKAQECAKVLVGDPHQQIYGFRGATDAMALIHADHTFHLTRVSCVVH